MRPVELLRQLDRKLLPPLIRGLIRPRRGTVRPRALAWLALGSAVLVLVTALHTTDQRPAQDLTVGEVTRVGVAQGESIPDYVASGRQELTTLLRSAHTGPAPEPYALVAFAEYLGPAQLVPVLAEVSAAAVFARVPLAQTQTQIVRIPVVRIPDDVAAGMAETADRKQREALDYQARGAALAEDADPALRAWYDDGARVALAEAEAYRSGCACVYAAVVRATAAALEELAARPLVRSVDPAPEVNRLERTVFTPPLPDQHDVARPPADSGVPPLGTDRTSSAPASSPIVGSTSAPRCHRPGQAPISWQPPRINEAAEPTRRHVLTVAGRRGVSRGVARIGFCFVA